jgi:hypothetical protein
MISKTTIPLLSSLYRRGVKSRRDDTLLTVDFNLRLGRSVHASQSPAGTTLWGDKISSGDIAAYLVILSRRLKSTVKKVLSLRVECKKFEYYFSEIRSKNKSLIQKIHNSHIHNS